jgi:hypothetical protein
LKEPTLVCSDQDMSYPYSIKKKQQTLVCSDQDMSYPYSIKYDISWSEHTSVGSFFLMLYDISWSEQTSVGSFSLMLYDISWSETGLLRSGYVIQH